MGIISPAHPAGRAGQHSRKQVSHSAPLFSNTNGQWFIVAKMQGVAPVPEAKLLFAYRSALDMRQHIVGCDRDIGGRSKAKFELGPDGRGRFWGEMRTDVPPGKEATMRSGYAGFRNKVNCGSCSLYSQPKLIIMHVCRPDQHSSATSPKILNATPSSPSAYEQQATPKREQHTL